MTRYVLLQQELIRMLNKWSKVITFDPHTRLT
jgi:hypothetical protein